MNGIILVIVIILHKLNYLDGDGGLGIGDWGVGIGPNPQSPIPNPQSPSKNIFLSIKDKLIN